jgi:uncharacterized protein (TIGR02646 family)
MIRIYKPNKAPRVLTTKGEAERERLCQAYDADPAAYRSGAKTFEFKSSIYGSAAVKRALIRAQHGKCAFCESRITHVAYGDVEHFRPKAGACQSEGDELERPGYYWLAYDWANLLASCQLCNQRFKRNLFPLADAARRARCHSDDLGAERPLLIHPAEEDPELFISFHGEVPCPVAGNARGEAAIRSLALDRRELNEMRLQLLAKLRLLHEIALLAADHPSDALLQSCAADASAELEKARQDDAQYAGMVRAAFPALAQ